MPFQKGHKTKGAGRPRKTDEIRITATAIESITKKYGSLEKGFIALLESEEPTLIKFVFEHAAGKPREKLDVDMNQEIEHVQVIQLPSNGRAITTGLPRNNTSDN